MKSKITLVLLMCTMGIWAQEVKVDQASCLKRYIGEWGSSVSPESNEIGDEPQIKMVNVPKMDGTALQVEVLRLRDGAYTPILVEMISYDSTTDKIVALGQNEKGECFSGIGSFSDKDNWLMVDRDFQGTHTQTVSFRFLSDTVVYLEGKDKAGQVLWKTRYIKN
ncbi:hypothetical protein Q4603_04275 [Zobellia galactanivorans]|uniref:Conserved hypothetical periplasmic protein n=1 Tax=Zobellia galactanivorans (strain DSM 12802 / CCUG 47099 / CIP 106680 / NCIMB 13871 / Dsij) TaxID=63186 RepID=G0L0B7_ZOBGA|nr:MULTISPECIES: hypothetical protein [Zobellia]MBU3027264.1 hypothetical protein [Zobellia galactanivorans]MDO6807805.1 hypothetical protein [Zobellia galactanivorans]OWW24717.1 hypothetical protein B4Q04_12665 [Zobellia sp. OII3]CAZ94243.1 Conserved hypothetical periplasmic protein [Zobellia galactanivorans]